MMPAPLDLSALYRKPVFRSRSPQTSQRELARAITAHDLCWGQGQVEAALFRHDLGSISIMALRYGAQVEVRPQAFRDFTLVQMPLRGTARFHTDGVIMPLGPGEVAVLSPQQSARLCWESGCEQLIVKLPHGLLADVLTETQAQAGGGLTPCQAGQPLALPSVYKLAPALLPVWRALVQQCLSLPGTDTTPQPSGALGLGWHPHPLWQRQFERGLALFLLAHQPAVANPGRPRGAAVAAGVPEAALGRTERQRLDRLAHHVHQHLGAPLTLAQLAQAAGVSPRSLHALCQRQYGMAPMAWLRECRLLAARALLQRHPERSITDIALETGFAHLGRFSAYYRERFGELPRSTLHGVGGCVLPPPAVPAGNG